MKNETSYEGYGSTFRERLKFVMSEPARDRRNGERRQAQYWGKKDPMIAVKAWAMVIAAFALLWFCIRLFAQGL